jgi:hypothetical protein
MAAFAKGKKIDIIKLEDGNPINEFKEVDFEI